MAEHQSTANDAIFAQALREAQEFHGGSGDEVYTPQQRREIGETARVIARRRGWRTLSEILQDA